VNKSVEKKVGFEFSVKNKTVLIFSLIAIVVISYLIYSSVTAPVFQRTDDRVQNVEHDPIQSPDTLITIAPIQLGNARFFLTPKAKYTIRGMLVSKRKYMRGFMARISPYDYALIWGNVPEMLPKLKFSQTYRYCLFNYKLSAPVDLDYVQTHMSNNHIIPSTKNIHKALKKAAKKDLVKIEGYLVDVIASVKHKGTSSWNTSLKRDDTWGGACEIIYVTKLQIDDKIYE